jgi:uncharacterized protein YkwD
MALRATGLMLGVALLACAGSTRPVSATSAEDALRKMLHPETAQPQGVEAEEPQQKPRQPPPPQQGGADAMAARMIGAVNALRVQKGLRPVHIEAALTRTAQDLAVDLAARHIISHEDASGAHLGDRLTRHGYDFNRAVENAGGGVEIPEFIVQLWTASPEHARNMYDPSVCEAGVGFVFLDRRSIPRGVLPSYWVLDLAQPGRGSCS